MESRFKILKAHEHGQSMHSSNEIASVQTFIEKNPNIHSSNVLDLHGLQVKEALNALKQIMFEKKQGEIIITDRQ